MKHKIGIGLIAGVTAVMTVIACSSSDATTGGDGGTADAAADGKTMPTGTATGTGTATSTATSTSTSTATTGTDGGPAPCTGGTTRCGDCCVNLADDPDNCGACANACTSGLVCSPASGGGASSCQLECVGGTTKCGASCVNTASDTSHCGSCDNACTPLHADLPLCFALGDAGPACSFHKCVTNFQNCDNNDANGCEADLTSTANCGRCGNTCGAGKCLNGGCSNVSCKAILAANAAATSGKYTIDPDGTGGADPFDVYCDMTSAGGGWTIVNAISGADGESPITSDAEEIGDALAFAAFNVNQAKKIAITAMSTESIFVRSGGAFLRANKPLFDANLANPNQIQAPQVVTLTASDATTAPGFMGYTTSSISGGGDFGVSLSPDGATCGGTTVNGFDQHNTASYRYLNCGCARMYLYSYSQAVTDGDAGYDVNTALGDWTATNGCDFNEGGSLAFYAAMR